jgi:hypothetical protein
MKSAAQTTATETPHDLVISEPPDLERHRLQANPDLSGA